MLRLHHRAKCFLLSYPWATETSHLQNIWLPLLPLSTTPCRKFGKFGLFLNVSVNFDLYSRKKCNCAVLFLILIVLVIYLCFKIYFIIDHHCTVTSIQNFLISSKKAEFTELRTGCTSEKMNRKLFVIKCLLSSNMGVSVYGSVLLLVFYLLLCRIY